METSVDIIEALAKNGADAVEIGMSFSDPLADGPVIQRATQIALSNGVTVEKTLQAVAELRSRGITLPLFLMGYYNPILAFGVEKFTDRANELNIAGLIIPDLPMEEAAELMPYLKNCALIQMVAPTTPKERLQALAKNAKGFIYLVSMTGITGSGSNHADNLSELIDQIKQYTDTPVCIGFGVSTYEKAAALSKVADGIVVGTRVIQEVDQAADPINAVVELAQGFAISILAK